MCEFLVHLLKTELDTQGILVLALSLRVYCMCISYHMDIECSV